MIKIYFPHELWNIIKNFQIDYKKHHGIKLKHSLIKIAYSFGEIYKICGVSFPPLREEIFPKGGASCRKKYILTSVCGFILPIDRQRKLYTWYYGYGWKNHLKKRTSNY